MQPTVHISKVLPPQIPHIILRPRLLKSLWENQYKKLTLILGQAAQGKSTLAATYVSGSSIPSAWVNLGPEDTDAVTLYYLLGQAIGQVLPEMDFSTALNYPMLTMGGPEEELLYRDWLNSLLKDLHCPVQIILDGLDRLAHGASAFDLLKVLLGEMPSLVRVFILSREQPPLDLKPLAQRQAIFQLTNADLAFNLEETADYFRRIRRFHLSPDLIGRIYELTEGWIGGLVLFCDSLDWVPENQRERYVSQELAGKFIWNIFQYFGEKTLAQLPREVQELLIKSSILDVMEPDFLEEAMGMANPKRILDELVKRNLFIQAIFDKKGGWSYKYHPLFREFLHGKFQTLVVREQQVDSYYQVAMLSERREDLETAVRFYLRAQAYPEAAAAIQKVGWELVKMGKTEELAQWLTALPLDLVQKNPWLLFYLVITKRFTGAPEATVILEKALSLFEETGEVQGRLLVLAHLLKSTITGYRPATPLLTLIEKAESLLASPQAGVYPYERAVLLTQAGLGQLLVVGNAYKGFLACQEAQVLAKSLGEFSLQASALLYAHLNLASMGEYSEALKINQKIDELLKKYPYPGHRAAHFLYRSICHLSGGDLDKAGVAIQEAQALMEKHGLTNLSPVGLLFDLMLKFLEGRFREAEALGQHLLSQSETMGGRFFHGIVANTLGASFYHEGDYPRARELLDYAQEILSSKEGLGLFHLRIGKLIGNLISCRCGDKPPDLEELQGLLDYFQTSSMPYFIAAAHLTLALANRQTGRDREACYHVIQGLRLAKEKGYGHFLEISRRDLLSACILALELEAAEVWDFAALLVAGRLADLAVPELARLMKHKNRSIADKAWELRQAIHRAGLSPLRFQTLGGFRVWRGKKPLEEKEWEGHQPQLLLKAIIARGPLGAPKEVLMEDLWPEASPHLSEKNFKVNLHRLRKTLEPDLDKTLDYSYVHLRASLVSLDPELCRVDMYEFLACCQEGEKLEQAGDPKGAASLYQRALELYGGEFLSEELYHTWIDSKREELQERLLTVLYRLAKIHEDRGSLVRAENCYIKAMQTDPLAEAACRRLMQLYAQRGLHNAAIRVYENCKRALQEMLNTDPEEVTTAIYRKVLESAARPGQTGKRVS